MSAALPSRPVPLDWGMLCLLAMIWGGSFSASEIALEGFPPFTLVTARLVLGAALLLALARAARARLPGVSTATDRRIWAHMAGLAFCSNVIPFCLLSWAQQHVTASVAGVSMATMPLFALPLSHLFVPGERMTRRRAAGFGFGFLGVAILFGPEAFAAEAGIEGWARLACLLAAFGYACGAVVARLSPPAPREAFSAGSVLIGAVAMIPLALTLEDPFALTPGAAAWGATLYLGVVPTAAAALLLVVLVQRAGPAFLSLVNYMVPVWATVFGALLFGDALGPRFLGALALILAGAAWAQGGGSAGASSRTSRASSGADPSLRR